MGRASLLLVSLLSGCVLTPELELRRIGASIRTSGEGDYHVSLRGKRADRSQLGFAANVGQGTGDLVELNLSWSRVKDEDLEWIVENPGKFEHLRQLDLRRTRVSDEAVDQVKEALPDCEVLHDPHSVTKDGGPI